LMTGKNAKNVAKTSRKSHSHPLVLLEQ